MKPVAFEQFARLESKHWWFRGRRAVYLELLRLALEGDRPRRILDVGAGVGGFLEGLSALGDEVIFTEFDAQAAALASARGSQYGIRARAEDLPLVDECADLVCLFDVIEHVQDDERALREVHRVLRPGGRIILSVPAHAWLHSRNDEVAGHVRRYERRSLVARIEAAGFQLKRCTYTNALLFPLIASVVLASKAAQTWAPVGNGGQHTNLSWKVPYLVNECLFRAFRAELAFSRQWDLPMGHSILAIAQKQTYGVRPLTLQPQARPQAALLQV